LSFNIGLLLPAKPPTSIESEKPCFSDKIEDSVFGDYKLLTEKTLQYGKEKNIPIEVSFITNFVWTKKDRVKKFLNENSEILVICSTIYDSEYYIFDFEKFIKLKMN
jgi:hypothetical protein